MGLCSDDALLGLVAKRKGQFELEILSLVDRQFY